MTRETIELGEKLVHFDATPPGFTVTVTSQRGQTVVMFRKGRLSRGGQGSTLTPFDFLYVNTLGWGKSLAGATTDTQKEQVRERLLNDNPKAKELIRTWKKFVLEYGNSTAPPDTPTQEGLDFRTRKLEAAMDEQRKWNSGFGNYSSLVEARAQLHPEDHRQFIKEHRSKGSNRGEVFLYARRAWDLYQEGRTRGRQP